MCVSKRYPRTPLQALLESESADGDAELFSKEGFVAAYRNGQRRVLRAALEEVQGMMGNADGEEWEER